MRASISSLEALGGMSDQEQLDQSIIQQIKSFDSDTLTIRNLRPLGQVVGG